MARFYADEQFPLPVVKHLRDLGHDVLTVQDAGKAEQGIPDEDVLAFAVSARRAVLTLNRYDFAKLHRLKPEHCGIVVCTNDRTWSEFARRIDMAVAKQKSLANELVRVTKPAR